MIVCVCVVPGAQGEGGLLSMRAAPAGDGGLLLLDGVFDRSEGSESRCRGDRALQSSRPLEAAAVAELQVALALRGCKGRRLSLVNLDCAVSVQDSKRGMSSHLSGLFFLVL